MAKNNINVVVGIDTARWKKDWDTVLKDAQKGGEDVEKSVKDLSAQVTGAFKKIENSTSLKSASRQMFNLAAALETGGNATSKAFRDSITQAGHLKDRIDDLNALVQVGGPAGPFIAMNNAMKIGVAGMNAVQSSMALIGNESEDLMKVMVKLQAGMALAGALKELEGIRDVWKQLNFTIAQNPVLIAVAGFTAFSAILLAVNEQLRGLSDIQKASNEVELKAIDIYAKEEAQLMALQKELNTGNLTREQQQNVIDEFNREHPKVIDGLDTERMTIDEVNKAITTQIALTRARAKAQAAESLYIEKYKKVLEAQRQQEINRQKGPGLFGYGGADPRLVLAAEQKAIEDLVKEADSYLNVWTMLEGEIKKSENALSSFQIAAVKLETKNLFGTDFTPTENKPNITPKKETETWIPKETSDMSERSKDPFGKLYNTDMLSPISPFEKISSSLDKLPAKVEAVIIPMRQLKSTVDGMINSSALMADALNNAVGPAINQMASAIGTAIATGEELGAVIGKTMLSAMANFMQQLGSMMITAGLAKLKFEAAMIALGPIGAPLAIAAGSALVAGAAIATAKIQQSNKPRAFADGGVIYGPTLGLMGEYAGASNNPEVVAPLDKLKSIIGSGGGNKMELTHKIDGRDLYIILKRTEKDMSRG